MATTFTFADLMSADLGLDPNTGLTLDLTGTLWSPNTITGDGTITPLESQYSGSNPYTAVVGTVGEDVFVSAGPNTANPDGFEVLVEQPGVGEVDFSAATSLNPTDGSNGPGIYVNLSLADQGLGPNIDFVTGSFLPSGATGGAGFAGVIDQSAQTVTAFSYLYGMMIVVGTNGSDIFITDQLADEYVYTGPAGPGNFDSLYGNGIEFNTANFGDFEGQAGASYSTVYGADTSGYHLGYYGANGDGAVTFGIYADLMANTETAADGFGNQQTVQVWSLDANGQKDQVMAHLDKFDGVLSPVGVSYINGNGNDNGFNYWGQDGMARTAIDPVSGLGGAPIGNQLGADAQYGFIVFNGGVSTPLLDANNVPLEVNGSAPGAYTPDNIDAALAAASLMGMGNEIEFADFGSLAAARHFANNQGVPIGVLPNHATGIYLDMAVMDTVTVPDPINGGTMTVDGSLVKLIEGKQVSNDALAMIQWSTHNDTVGDLVNGVTVAGVTSTATGSDVVYGDGQDNFYTYCGDGTLAPGFFDGRGQAGPHVAADGTVYLGGEVGDAMDFSEFAPLNLVGVNADLSRTYANFTDAIGDVHHDVYKAFTIGDPGGRANPNSKVLLAAFTNVEDVNGSGNNDFLQGVYASEHPVYATTTANGVTAGDLLGYKATDFNGLDGSDTFAFTQLTNKNNGNHWSYNPNINPGAQNKTNYSVWHADFGNAEIVDFDATTGQHDMLMLNHLDWMGATALNADGLTFADIFNTSLSSTFTYQDKVTAEALYILNNYTNLDANGNVVIHAYDGTATDGLDVNNTITLQNVDLNQDLKTHASADFQFV